MSESISGTPEVGGESDPVGDVHGIVDGDQSEPFAPASEGSDVGAEPGAPDTSTSELVDPGPSPEMISALAATEIPENLAEHWDHDGALRLYHEALAEGVAPETISKLMNAWSKGQSERLPQMMEAAQEQADAQMDEAAAARAAQSRRALQHEWKDGYEGKLKTARDVAANLLGADEVQRLVQIRLADGSLFGDSPTLIKMLAKLGGHMALESSQQLAQQDLDELEGDESFTKHFYDQSDTPAHRAAVAKHQKVFDRAFPEEAPAVVEPATAEAKAAAKAELKKFSDVKGLGAELSKAMSNLDDPRDRSDKDRQTLARWGKANKIADAPIATSGASAKTTRAEAKAEIDRLEKDPSLYEEPTVGSGVEVHRALIKRRDALYAIAYPD